MAECHKDIYQYYGCSRGQLYRFLKKHNMKEQVKSIDYEIDHIFSLKDCWKYKIHPYYASCEKNLQILTQKQNKEKGSKSPYGINEFMSIVGVQRLSKAQFDWKQVE